MFIKRAREKKTKDLTWIIKIFYLCIFRKCNQKKSTINTNPIDDDDESSSDTHPVINSMIDRNLTNNGKICLVNGRPGTICDSSEQPKPILYADPWIRRCDHQPSSIDYMYNNQQEQRQKSIQYETRLYYHSLSSTSDDHLSQQQRQPLLNNIDKDIEYVESRLRGQTTVSLPASHSANYKHDASWRRHHHSPQKNFINVLSSSLSNDQQQQQQQQQTRSVHQKYSNNQQINETSITTPKLLTQKPSSPITNNSNGSVKTVKNRIEKVKDQKAAKTLR